MHLRTSNASQRNAELYNDREAKSCDPDHAVEFGTGVWPDAPTHMLIGWRGTLAAAGERSLPDDRTRLGPQVFRRRLDLKVLPIRLPPDRLPIGIVTLKNRTLSPVAQLFIEVAREVARPRAKRG